MVKLRNPFEVARQEADRLAARGVSIEESVQPALRNSPWVDPQSLLAGLEDFHKERMRRIPAPTKYPESPAWVEHILAVDRELKKLANLSDREMAILRSFGAYATFRGFGAAKPLMAEKCRVAYLPDSDVGQIHIKNIDDPASSLPQRLPPPQALLYSEHLVHDGTGSGLHIDDEPEEIFPLWAPHMLCYYADDVPGAVQFYTRYKPFWWGGNTVLHDKQKRSVAIEKCSANFIEVFYPGPEGQSHCSGMVCRNPDSPQGRYQRQKRAQYLQRFGQSTAGPEQTFWIACDRAERMLAEALTKWGPRPRLDDVLKLFHTPWPEGLSKEGKKLHPQLAVEEYTLVTHASLLDRKKFIRWQRDTITWKMPEAPETYQF